MKYRKKPILIEAFRLGIDYIPNWFMDEVSANKVILHGSSSGFYHFDDTYADIETLEGWLHASYGDFIIRGVEGEIYPCKPSVFKMTYVDDASTVNVVEVVRCKDCVHRHSKLYCPMCDLLADMSEDEGFCHLGTRGDSDA